ncbi:MAG TPA: WcbI family polysaccharide biosynthesis putative acetyltransferase [Candidatus Baltobacteraceae bacterium]
MSANDRPVVVVYGNCQAQFIQLLTSEVPALAELFSFVQVPSTLPPGEPFPELPEDVSRAALVWEQYHQHHGLEPSEEFRSRLPANCEIVRYPGLNLMALWPFATLDERNVPEPRFPWGRYPFGDLVAIEVAQLGLPPRESFERYMERSRAQMPDLAQLVARNRSILEARDAGCEVKMADFVFSNLTSTEQFWAFGHLTSVVFAELISQLLARSVHVLGDMDALVAAQLEAVFARFPAQGETQLPIHPMVVEEIGLSFCEANRLYRWFDHFWTFEEYMTRYIQLDATW